MAFTEIRPQVVEPEIGVSPTPKDFLLLHAFAYKRYQANQDLLILPKPTYPPNTTVIFAGSEGLKFNPNNDPKTFFTPTQTKQLKRLSSVCAGFFTVETTSLPHQLPEAFDLFDWDGWQLNQKVDYLGGFSPHPWLSTENKLSVLQQLFSELITLQQSDPPDLTLIILADHVKSFVESTNMVKLHQLSARPKTESLSVQTLQTNFPSYWAKNPQLYQFNMIK